MSNTLVPPPVAPRPVGAKTGLGPPDDLQRLDLPAGSMGPKVQAASNFARTTGREAVIGSLVDIAKLVDGTAGTRFSQGR